MLILLMTVFILFALFCAGRLVRPLMLPVIVVMTLGYVLHWAGLFNTAADATKSPRKISQPNGGP
jgi:hypothetical protein